MSNLGSVFGNVALDGIPGMLRAALANVESCAAVRPTVRRVSPMRTSFRTLVENVC